MLTSGEFELPTTIRSKLQGNSSQSSSIPARCATFNSASCRRSKPFKIEQSVPRAARNRSQPGRQLHTYDNNKADPFLPNSCTVVVSSCRLSTFRGTARVRRSCAETSPEKKRWVSFFRAGFLSFVLRRPSLVAMQLLSLFSVVASHVIVRSRPSSNAGFKEHGISMYDKRKKESICVLLFSDILRRPGGQGTVLWKSIKFQLLKRLWRTRVDDFEVMVVIERCVAYHHQQFVSFLIEYNLWFLKF